MPCFKPLDAWQGEDGRVAFVERPDSVRTLQLPCGQCIGCRLERSRQWAVRCMHESQLHEYSSFVTLTYNDDNVQTSLDYKDFQLFMKRLRKQYKSKIRFYMCGEYGEQYKRPHFHACLFGIQFSDKKLYKELPHGGRLYTSAILEKLWPYGYSTIGDVTFETAAYVARYCMKKVTGDMAEEHYKRVDIRTGELIDVIPEFNRMSLKPGIGRNWIEKYQDEVFNRNNPTGAVVSNSTLAKPSRYYYNYLASVDSQKFTDVEYSRWLLSKELEADNSPDRLKVKEKVAKARYNLKSRQLE